MDRRALLTGLGVAAFAASQQAAANLNRDRLVVIFLRGGADALSILPPLQESEYYRLRPRLALPAPGQANGAINLDGQFGLHPQLAPLKPLYDAGILGFIHATGLDIDSRSHFEMQRLIELGGTSGGIQHGWLGRHLQNLNDNPSPLRAVSLNPGLPKSMRGDPTVAALPVLNIVQGLGGMAPGYYDVLEALQGSASPLGFPATGASALDLMNALESAQGWNVASNATYPDTEMGNSLKQLAQLIKADMGTEVAHLDDSTWDTHQRQSTTLPAMLSNLAHSLLAFHNDLGALMSSTTVIVMTEFGRRLVENGDGTAHGSGGCMLAMGAGVNGGQVHGQWPGLAPADLDDGDLRITTDYRQVLSDYLQLRRGETSMDSVFPGFQPGQSSGLFQAA